MNGYNLLVKAPTAEEAIEAVTEYLSVPVQRATAIGYGEVTLSIKSERDLKAELRDWHDKSRPKAPDAYEPGSLITWTGNE